MKVIESVREAVNAGDKILVAVSGGPDSMALLDALNRLRNEVGFELAAAHLNHGLREEAAEEEAGVRDFCEGRGIPFLSERVDLSQSPYAKLSLEEAGRKARYGFFGRLIGEYGFNKLFTAHHLNDQAETVLMRLARGTGPKGAAGIKPVGRFGAAKIIRPFLGLFKVDLIEYCSRFEVPYFEDSSNQENIYSRNIIRNEVFPILEERQPGVQANIARFAREMAEQQAFIDCILNNLLDACVKKTDMGVTIEGSLFEDPRSCLKPFGLARLDSAGLEFIKKQAVRRALELMDAQRDVSEAHIQDAVKLFESKGSGSINFPGNFMAILNSGVYKIMKRDDIPKPFGDYEIAAPFETERTYYFPREGKALKFKPGLAGDFENPSKDSGKALLRMGPLAEKLEFRRRRQGDEVFLSGMHGRKKLSRYMIDKKIPGFLRESIPILAQGNKVLWIPGHYIHRDFLITSPQDPAVEVSLMGF